MQKPVIFFLVIMEGPALGTHFWWNPQLCLFENKFMNSCTLPGPLGDPPGTGPSPAGVLFRVGSLLRKDSCPVHPSLKRQGPPLFSFTGAPLETTATLRWQPASAVFCFCQHPRPQGGAEGGSRHRPGSCPAPAWVSGGRAHVEPRNGVGKEHHVSAFYLRSC